jgi:hypothetical protein
MCRFAQYHGFAISLPNPGSFGVARPGTEGYDPFLDNGHEEALATESTKSQKRRAADRDFVKQFTTLVSKRPSSLSAAEQDKRIQTATRVVSGTKSKRPR